MLGHADLQTPHLSLEALTEPEYLTVCTDNRHPPRRMAGSADALECPLCPFTVLPANEYVLRLHFEQVHTTDSPFRIENDPEPLPPPISTWPSPPRMQSQSSKHVQPDTPSSDENDNSVLCPEPDCGELVPIIDFYDHLDYHAAESLSFDETTGKYHSQRLATMHGPASTPSFLEQKFGAELPGALRRNEDARSKAKKGKRGRSDTTGSEKSTLSRSILSCNPFAKADRKVRPPASNCRLGVGPFTVTHHSSENLTPTADRARSIRLGGPHA